MSIRQLQNDSFKVIWKSKWIWYSSFLISLAGIIYGVIPNVLVCITGPLRLLAFAASTLCSIGLEYAIFRTAKGEKVEFQDWWGVSKNRFFRVIAIGCIAGILVIACIVVFFVCVQLGSHNLDTSSPWVRYSSLLVLYLSSLGAFFYLGSIIEDLSVSKSINRGYILFTHHLGTMLVVALIAITIPLSVAIASVQITHWIQPGFAGLFGNFNSDTMGVSTSSLLFRIIMGIGTFLTTPFASAWYVLAYKQFSEAEPIVSQPAELVGLQAYGEELPDSPPIYLVRQDDPGEELVDRIPEEPVSPGAFDEKRIDTIPDLSSPLVTDEEAIAIPDDAPLSVYLDQAEAYGRSGKFGKAGRVLEQAQRVNPSWAPKLAGYQGGGLSEPASGYYLLLKLAGRAGEKAFALRFFRHMLNIRPILLWDIREAVRNAGIEAEAKDVVLEKGLTWNWYE